MPNPSGGVNCACIDRVTFQVTWKSRIEDRGSRIEDWGSGIYYLVCFFAVMLFEKFMVSQAKRTVSLQGFQFVKK